MEFVVVEQPFAITVVVLYEQVLVFVFEESGTQLDDCVEIEIPTAAFGENDRSTEPSIVAHVAAGQLKDTAVFEYVAVIPTVDNGNPCFELQLYIAVDGECSHERYFVPAA